MVIRWCPAEAAPSILGVAVCLLFTLTGGNALVVSATDDTAIGVTNASAQAAKDLAVVIAPAPDSTQASLAFACTGQDEHTYR